MSRAAKLNQIKHLRETRVDRFTQAAMEARRALNAAEAALDDAHAHYEALRTGEAATIDTLLAQTLEIDDPAARLAAMNQMVVRVRAARAEAYADLARAEGTKLTREGSMQRASEELTVARAQLDGVARVCATADAAEIARADDAADEDVLETFAGRRAL